MDIQVLKAVIYLAMVEWHAAVPVPCFRGL